MFTFNVVQFAGVHHCCLGAENLQGSSQILLARLHGEDRELLRCEANSPLQGSNSIIIIIINNNNI